MCGVIGFSWDDKPLAKAMADMLAHRGPDASGIYTDRGISLGHRRLSIVDLTENGSQPMFNEDNSVVVVFNGEIYNYKSIKKELHGHKFISTSDTEVIIHGYEQFGEKIFSMLEGMFAIALWDKKNKKLLLARDRIGKKPLYYYQHKKNIIFSSEIKSILLYSDYSRKIDQQCLSDYLSMRYSTGNRTMFKDIFKVQPGTYTVFKEGKLTIHKYWDLPKLLENYVPKKEEVDKLIEQAVEKRLMADVPIGTFLSGGLDSSTIVAYLARLGYKTKTFSVGFGDNTDETKYAELVASKFNTEHKTIILSDDIVSLLPKIVWHFDEPLADPAAVPTFQLCKEVSKSVKVALSGEGGDESFGGYYDFNYINKLKLLAKLPSFSGKLIAPILRKSSLVLEYPLKQQFMLASELADNNKNIILNQEKLLYLPFSKEDKKRLLQNKKLNYNLPIESYLKYSKNPHNNIITYYFKEWLPNDLLMKGDKMSMASGLELRMPFLDIKLIDYFCKIDNKYKQDRKLFRQVVSSLLPKEILKKKKQGFVLPISNWFVKKAFQERIMPQLEDLEKRKILDSSELRKIISKPTAFRNDHRIWTLLNFELWNKEYLDDISKDKIKL
jgi:asparagine synthase (glutamine-hydrolysing)